MVEPIGDNGLEQNFKAKPLVVKDEEGLHIALNAIMEMQRATLEELRNINNLLSYLQRTTLK